MAVVLAEDSQLGKAGQTVQLALTPSDVHITEEMDTFLAGFSPFEFRADEVSSPTPLVVKEADSFRLFSSNNAFRRVDVESSTQEDVKQVDPETEFDNYQTIERALGSFVPARTQAQAAPLYDPQQASARRINWALALDREVRLWALLEDLAEWDANNQVTLAGATRWDQTTADPILNLQQRIENSSQPVSDIWMNVPVGHTFLRHDTVRTHMRQMLGDNAPEAGTVAAAGAQARVDFTIPGLPPIHIVPGKVLNETTGALDFILGDSVILQTKGSGLPTSGEEIMTVQTFREAGPSGTGFTSREFFVDKKGLHGGTMIVAGHAEDIKFISNTCGGIISDVLT